MSEIVDQTTIETSQKPLSEAMNVTDYTRAILKRKWLGVLIFIGVVFFTFLFTIRQPKIYEAVATIEIDLQADRVLSDVSEVYQLGDVSYWDSKSYFETQYKIIQSHSVAKLVVDRLHLDRDLVFLGLDKLEDEAELTERLAAADAARIVQDNLFVDPVYESRLVRIRYSGTDPLMAATIANAIANAYIDQNLDRKLSSTRSAINWLTEQMQDLKTRLEVSERAVYEFKQEHDILSTSMDERVNIIGSQLNYLDAEYTKARTELMHAESRYDSIRRALKQSDAENVASADILSNPLIKELKVTYAKLQNDYSELLERYKDKHPKVLLVQSKLEKTRSNLRREIRIIAESLKAEFLSARSAVDQIAAELERVKGQMRNLTVKELEYNRLMREKESNQRVFEQVLLRLKEIDLSGMLKVNNIRLLDEAKTPEFAIRPRVKLNLIIGILFGLVLSLATVIILDLLDKTLKSAEDIQRFLKLPLLGIIPQVKPEPELLVGGRMNAADMYSHLRPKSSMAECIRTIRTNISFMSPGKPITKILVTSASPKEGKTTIASNLGISLSNSGLRVLVLDTDMRRPRLHKAMGMHNEYGLSNVIMGTMTIEEAVRDSEVENLFVMTCGPIPPNPAELIGSDEFAAVVSDLASRYDRLIFDSPPVIAVTDAMVLTRLVDGVILVVKCGKTLRDVALQAKKQLMDVKARVLGSIINDLDLDNKEYGSYYYYYYHRYGYYYGEKEEQTKADSTQA